MKYILLYCIYDPDNYSGHRVHHLNAKDLPSAKIEAKAFLDGKWLKCNNEFRLLEVTHDSCPRLWDTRQPAEDGKRSSRDVENEYTSKNYWEV